MVDRSHLARGDPLTERSLADVVEICVQTQEMTRTKDLMFVLYYKDFKMTKSRAPKLAFFCFFGTRKKNDKEMTVYRLQIISHCKTDTFVRQWS